MDKKKKSDKQEESLIVDEIATIFVDRNYHVKHFTSGAADIFNLTTSDKGRPLEQFTRQLNDGTLNDIKKMFGDSGKVEKEVWDENGRRYMMHLRPYQTIDGHIEGAIITFVDVTELKAAEAELAQQVQQQELMATLGLYALEQKNLQSVLDRAVEYSIKLLKTECALLLMLNEEKDTLCESVHIGWNDEHTEKIEVKVDKKTDAGFALYQNEPVVITDFKKEKRFKKLPLPLNLDIVSGINVAVKGTEDVYGVLCVYSGNKRNFAGDEVDYIQIIASLLGVTIERHHTESKLKTSNEQLSAKVEEAKELQRQILKNDVNERWRIGQYLHDELAQSLVAAEFMLNHLKNELKKEEKDFSEEIDQLKGILKQSVAGARDLSHEIVPIDVEEEGVIHAFESLSKQLERLYDLDCELEGNNMMHTITDIEVATNLYRIAHEAARNAAVHGQAKNIRIELNSDEQFIYLNIEDDGKGFSASSDKEEGMGINIMRHRMELLGGTLEIKESSDSENKGVMIVCKVPL